MSNTPIRYKGVKYEEVPQQIRDLFEKVPETRRGLFIHGDVGTGKTHIAYALKEAWERPTERTRANLLEGKDEVYMHQRRAMFWNTTELLRSIKGDFDKAPAEKERAEERIMEHPGLLFLDDVGSEKMSEWVAETFYLIVNSRYNRMLPTIYTSNFGVADLAERIGDRTVSRIVGSSDVVELKGPDRRITSEKITINL